MLKDFYNQIQNDEHKLINIIKCSIEKTSVTQVKINGNLYSTFQELWHPSSNSSVPHLNTVEGSFHLPSLPAAHP